MGTLRVCECVCAWVGSLYFLFLKSQLASICSKRKAHQDQKFVGFKNTVGKNSDLKARARSIAARQHTTWRVPRKPVSSEESHAGNRERTHGSHVLASVGAHLPGIGEETMRSSLRGKNNTEERCLQTGSVLERCTLHFARGFPGQVPPAAYGCPLDSSPLKHTHSQILLFSPLHKRGQSPKHSCLPLLQEVSRNAKPSWNIVISPVMEYESLPFRILKNLQVQPPLFNI